MIHKGEAVSWQVKALRYTDTNTNTYILLLMTFILAFARPGFIHCSLFFLKSLPGKLQIIKLLISSLSFPLLVGTALTILISVTTVAALLVMSLCFCLWKCFLRKEGECMWHAYCIFSCLSMSRFLSRIKGKSIFCQVSYSYVYTLFGPFRNRWKILLNLKNMGNLCWSHSETADFIVGLHPHLPHLQS